MQTGYAINTQPVAFPGQPADLSFKQVVTALASEVIGYGLLVVRSTAASFDKVIGALPAQATDVTNLDGVLGVSMADQARAQDPSQAGAVYPSLAAVPCMGKGHIWVKVEQNVLAGQSAFVRFADSENTPALVQKGAFRMDADTKTAVDSAAQLKGAVYLSDALADGYAMLAVNCE